MFFWIQNYVKQKLLFTFSNRDLIFGCTWKVDCKWRLLLFSLKSKTIMFWLKHVTVVFCQTALKKCKLPSRATITIHFFQLYYILTCLIQPLKQAHKEVKPNLRSVQGWNPGNNLIKLYKKNDLSVEDNAALMCFISTALPAGRGSAHMSLLFCFHASRHCRLRGSAAAATWLLNGTISWWALAMPQ